MCVYVNIFIYVCTYVVVYALSVPGTLHYHPPEWFKHQFYMAGPMTVWQIGLLAYQMLVGEYPFDKVRELISKEPPIGSELSPSKTPTQASSTTTNIHNHGNSRIQ